jgi:hypothetical protein
MSYTHLKRFTITQDSHCLTVNEFKIKEGDLEISQVIADKVLENEIIPEKVKNNNKYLDSLFISEYLSKKDFKFINSDGIYFYLEGFSDSTEDWGDDKNSFEILLNEFKSFTSLFIKGCFLINKDWFTSGSTKVRKREYTLYDYYLLIILKGTTIDSNFFIFEFLSD